LFDCCVDCCGDDCDGLLVDGFFGVDGEVDGVLRCCCGLVGGGEDVGFKLEFRFGNCFASCSLWLIGALDIFVEEDAIREGCFTYELMLD